MSEKEFGVEEWGVVIKKPLKCITKEIEAVSKEFTSISGPKVLVAEEFSSEWGPGVAHEWLSHHHKVPGEGSKASLYPEKDSFFQQKATSQQSEVDSLRKRLLVIEAALGIRSDETPHILRVAKEAHDTWIADGMRLKIRFGQVVDAGEMKK